MPKRTDLKSILIIGAGPIVIGQACEFDYSGAQACKALREEGYKVILVNSNPATIMTDPEMADVTYIEPITAAVIAYSSGTFSMSDYAKVGWVSVLIAIAYGILVMAPWYAFMGMPVWDPSAPWPFK